MKNNVLQLQTLLDWKKQIDSGVSTPLFRDPATGNLYTAKSVTEYVSGFYTELEAKNGKVLISANKPDPGVRSFDGNKLQPDVNQLVYAITWLSGTATASTRAALVATDFTDKAPAYFRNGELQISQGTELVRTTGGDVNNGYASTGNDDNFKAVAPFAFRDNMTIDVVATLADSAAANDAYRFEYRAIEFVLAEKAS